MTQTVVHGCKRTGRRSPLHLVGRWRTANRPWRRSREGCTMSAMPFMPPFIAPTFHHDPESALEQVRAIYAQQINHLREAMQRFVAGEAMPGRVRGCYPYVRIHTDSVVPQAALENSGLSYGFV